MADATWLEGDLITDAMAAIAEFPQMEFPVATNIETLLSSFNINLQSKKIRDIPAKTEIIDIVISDIPLSFIIEKFILKPRSMTANSNKFLETNFGALSSLEKNLGILFGIFFTIIPINKEIINTSKIFESKIKISKYCIT